MTAMGSCCWGASVKGMLGDVRDSGESPLQRKWHENMSLQELLSKSECEEEADQRSLGAKGERKRRGEKRESEKGGKKWEAGRSYLRKTALQLELAHFPGRQLRRGDGPRPDRACPS